MTQRMFRNNWMGAAVLANNRL